jgi:hypothetical protein
MNTATRIAELQRSLDEGYAAATPEKQAEMTYRQALRETIGALKDRVAALEARLVGDDMRSLADEAAGGPVMRWRGFWTEDVAYKPGETVAFNDSLHVCERALEPGVRPGGGAHTGWKLVLKRPDLRGAARNRV